MMTMISGKYDCTGASVLGATHLKNGKPCQDAYTILSENKFTVICAADGHGSQRCPFSDEGSKAAVQETESLLASICKNTKKAFSSFDANKEIWLPKQIEERWKTRVREIHTERERDTDIPFSYELYGTTLLALAAADDFIFAMQIGDGDILAIPPDSQPNWLIPPVESFGSETESLCMENAWQYIRTRIIPITEKSKPVLFWLSTDGYANSFTNEAGFLKAGTDIYALWQNEGKDYIEAHLNDWLSLSTTEGSGDDITVVLMMKPN
jgi:serine/threonine protein phosphatase PrpC